MSMKIKILKSCDLDCLEKSVNEICKSENVVNVQIVIDWRDGLRQPYPSRYIAVLKIKR